MRRLRAVLIVGVLAAFGYTAATVRWDAVLTTGSHSWLLDWGRHPIWSPPTPPDLQQFQAVFHGRPQDGTIRVSYDPSEILVLGLVRAWPVLAFCTLCYWLEHPNAEDRLLHIVGRVTITLLLSATLCLLLSCVMGGWGPLFPVFFAVAGLVGGLWLGNGSLEPTDDPT